MGCCCTNTLGLCDQNVCGDGVEFEATAAMPGVYKMVVQFLNMSFAIEAEFAQDDVLIFPIDQLNENFEYTVEIFDPVGDKVTIAGSGEIEYDCFKFRTILQKTLVAVEVES